eukprot:Colp12_sorted_trinity150504_noHs@10768
MAKTNSYNHAIAGITAGFVSTAILHPLDLVKVRMQVQDGLKTVRPQYNNTLHAFRTIAAKEGISALYQGLVPNLAGGAMSWGAYFYSYNLMKDRLKAGGKKVLGPLEHMFCASVAGATTLLMTNPVWVVKTRMCLQVQNASQHVYRGLFDGLRTVWRTEGLAGLYAGLSAGLLGVSHGAVQFMVYEEFKKVLADYRGTETYTQNSTLEYIMMATSAKLTATTVTYPFQVLRSRIQQQDASVRYRGLVSSAVRIWRREGFQGFYRGLGPQSIRVLPATCITFVVYEKLSTYLKEANK